MKKITFLIVLLFGITLHLFSQTYHSDTLSINNIKALVRAGGLQFWEPTSPYINDTSNRSVFEYPKGSGKNTIFCSSLWFAGKDINNNLKVAAETYNQTGTDFWTGPLTTNGTASTTQAVVNAWDKVWGIKKQELLNYLSSTSYPSNPPSFVLNWPVYGDTNLNQSYLLAPYVDIDSNGSYEPYMGDYPQIYGDQCYFFIINDKKIHTETQGDALGLEIQVFAYAFNNLTDTALNNTIFYKYKIINRSINTYTDCYAGFYTDFDIGYAFDDYIGCDVERSTCFAYNGTLNDGNGQNHSYGANPPVQGMTILKGAKMDPDALDNPKFDNNGNQLCDHSVNGTYFGDGIIDNERYGMSRFIYFNNSNGPTGQPDTSFKYFYLISGNWNNNLPLTWGGSGYDTSSNISTRFIFPGLSDSTNWGTGCGTRPTPNDWSEVNSNNPPADRRGLSSMGPFVFHPNDIQEIDICYSTAASVNALTQNISHIQNLLTNSPEIFQGYVGVNEINEIKFNIYPNPATDELVIDGLQIKNLKYEIYNIVGLVVKSGNLEKSDKQKIKVSNLQSGVYLIKLSNLRNVKTQKFIKK